MRLTACLAVVVGAVAVAFGGSARAGCRLEEVGRLPVVFAEGHLLLPTSINGRSAMMIADTGAFASTLSEGAPERLGLATHAFPTTFGMQGVGGKVDARVARVDELKVGQFVAHNLDLLVGGHGIGSQAVVGLMGADLFGQFDTEIDLPHGVVRLLRDTGCTDAQLPYWGKAYSQAPLDPDASRGFFTRLKLNGHEVKAMLDTGAFATTITPGVAQLAGGRRQVNAPSIVVGGVGAHTFESEVYAFDTVGLGDETVKGARLLAADMFRYNTQVVTGSLLGRDISGDIRALIGLDFFRSHHVLISPGHHLVYFTYEGGEPFAVPRPAPSVQAGAPRP